MINKKLLHQVMAMTPVNHVEFMMGFGTGWVPQVLSWLSHILTVEQSSWIGSLYFVGRSIGPFISTILIDRIGRCMLFSVASFLLFIPWIALLCYEPDVAYVQYAARLAMGIASGIHEMATGIYIGENCSPSMRGMFNGVVIVYYMMGMLLVYILGTYCTYQTMNIAGAIAASVTLCSTYILKEPANYLLMKGQVEKAVRNFFWLRANVSNSEEMKKEFNELKDYIEKERNKERESFRSRVSTPGARRSLRIVIILTLILMTTGFSSVNSYITIAFVGAQFSTPNELTIVYGIIQFIMLCLGSPLIDKFNRRNLLICSSLMSSCVSLVAAFIFIFERYHNSMLLTTCKFVVLCIHAGIFLTTLYPLMAAIRGELLSYQVKALGSGLAIVVGSFGCFLTTQIFLPVSVNFGMEYNFFIYAIFGIAGAVYVYIDLPETRGKTLVHIQNELNNTRRKYQLSIVERNHSLHG